jgi:hypothetical protein
LAKDLPIQGEDLWDRIASPEQHSDLILVTSHPGNPDAHFICLGVVSGSGWDAPETIQVGNCLDVNDPTANRLIHTPGALSPVLVVRSIIVHVGRRSDPMNLTPPLTKHPTPRIQALDFSDVFLSDGGILIRDPHAVFVPRQEDLTEEDFVTQICSDPVKTCHQCLESMIPPVFENERATQTCQGFP